MAACQSVARARSAASTKSQPSDEFAIPSARAKRLAAQTSRTHIAGFPELIEADRDCRVSEAEAEARSRRVGAAEVSQDRATPRPRQIRASLTPSMSSMEFLRLI